MKILVVVIGGALLLMLSGCGLSPEDRAKTLVFGKSGKSINDLLENHPQVIKESIEWYEDDSLEQKGVVICRFSYIAPIRGEKKQFEVDLLFTIGKKTGRLWRIQAENVFQGSPFAPYFPKYIDSASVEGFLDALENKTSILAGVMGLPAMMFETEKDAKNNDGWTALMIAAEKGHVKTVETLLAKDADVNAKNNDGRTALMIAAGKRHAYIVEMLLAKDAEVNAKNNDGWTALMIAAKEGHTKIVETLLAKDAEVNAKNNDGRTALMIAAKEGHTEIVETLLAKGAEVNAKSNKGGTALMFAAGEGHAKTVETLLAKGADVNAKNNGGYTALMGAVRYGHANIVRLLKQAGAKE